MARTIKTWAAKTVILQTHAFQEGIRSVSLVSRIWYGGKIILVSFAWWSVVSLMAIWLFAFLGSFITYTPKSMAGSLLWPELALSQMVGFGVILWRWEWIKKAAARYSLVPDEAGKEALKNFLIQCMVGAIALPVVGAAILLVCALLWGGYTMLSAIPIPVAILGGAGLVALAIVALAKKPG